MCVHDDLAELLELKRDFTGKGIPCEAFSDPHKALRAYDESVSKRCCRYGFPLIVTAVQMPVLDGPGLSIGIWSAKHVNVRMRHHLTIVGISSHVDHAVKT